MRMKTATECGVGGEVLVGERRVKEGYLGDRMWLMDFIYETEQRNLL
jgi:hypothetical protein